MLFPSKKHVEKSILLVIEVQRQGVFMADKILLADINSLPLRSGRRYCSEVAKPREIFN